MSHLRICALGLALSPFTVAAGGSFGMPTGPVYENSIGMRFVRIEPGTFTMGVGSVPLPAEIQEGRSELANGDYDEYPNHLVTITQPFYLGAFEVTNGQYELFDPGHRALRGKLGFSRADDEAVVFVSWHEARAFCEWLAAREGLPYRLPTEAEWEYACRAGTTTHYHTGDLLPAAYRKNQIESWYPDPDRVTNYPADYLPELVPLTVGQTPPNVWGLHDMHGNVEEWCQDWYGPYAPGPQSDPVGRADGDFRVTRVGSHGTLVYYLRSANRMGALPEDRHWLIGFRVALAPMPVSEPLPPPPPPRVQQEVAQTIPPDIDEGPDPLVPLFRGPRKYVKVPAGSSGPLFSWHNHDPGITECANGDLLAIWYTTVSERGRYLALAASRLPYAQRNDPDPWQEASPFWDTPDRNDHAPAIWHDGAGTLYHFNGLSAAATWGNLAIILRISRDNGATWSRARPIAPEHGIRHQPAEAVIRTTGGAICLTADASSRGNGGTALHVSHDNGLTWSDAGGKAAGIHAGVVELRDGRLLALGRGDTIDGMMPLSLSPDLGRTWTYQASVFPPIGGGQRLALLRLMEGPLFLASFAFGMVVSDTTGTRTVRGLYAALSYDDGLTWPVRRLISDESGRSVETTNGELFTMTATTAEPKGYLSVTQTRDRTIHLISSRQHYALNLTWIRQRATTTRADWDCDRDVDLGDYAYFQACFNGAARPPGRPCCEFADYDHDGDVDVSDFRYFQLCFNGSNRPPTCSG